MGYKVEDILIEKEKRIRMQKKLMDRFNNPLIFIKVNYPGVNKNNNTSNSIMQKMDMLISDIFDNKVQMRLFRTSAEGPNVIMILNDSPTEIKSVAIQIEDKHMLGPFIDIDVYDNKSGKLVSRSELDMEPKKCFLCGGIAENCVSIGSHKEDEIIRTIQNKYKEFMKSFYGKIV